MKQARGDEIQLVSVYIFFVSKQPTINSSKILIMNCDRAEKAEKASHPGNLPTSLLLISRMKKSLRKKRVFWRFSHCFGSVLGSSVEQGLFILFYSIFIGCSILLSLFVYCYQFQTKLFEVDFVCITCVPSSLAKVILLKSFYSIFSQCLFIYLSHWIGAVVFFLN